MVAGGPGPAPWPGPAAALTAVLRPSPPCGTITRTGQFREDGSRHAEDDQAADLRLLDEGAGEGRTVLVRMNCRGCRHGVPASPPDDVELLVWEFVVR